MFGVSTVLWSLIAWYVDNVKPGPFGQARPLYFIFLVMDSTLQKNIILLTQRIFLILAFLLVRQLCQ